MKNNYDDIIELPHPEPKHHVRMDRAQRAAQFAPFAALTGYDRAVDEATRDYESNLEERNVEYRETP